MKVDIEHLNENRCLELWYMAIRYSIEMATEANKAITKNIVSQNVSELASQLYQYIGSFKSMFDFIICQGIPSPWDENGDLYPR